MRYKDFIIRQIKEWLSELDKEQQSQQKDGNNKDQRGNK